MDRRSLVFGAGAGGIGATVGGIAPAQADTEELMALYRGFLAAQNRRDIEATGAFLLDSPGFLWVSDGKAFWGRATMLERMSAFQKADIWVVRPDFTRSRIVSIATGAASLFQPLTLTLGPQNDARTIAFLVNIIFTRVSAGWRIAALLTTEENPA